MTLGRRTELRPNPELVRQWLQKHRGGPARSNGFSRRKAPIGRKGRIVPSAYDTAQEAARATWNRGRGRCVVCGDRATDFHHVVYRQHLPEALLWDTRNRLPLCRTCHERQHNGSRRIELARLPDAAFEFAGETFGAGAFDYLSRRYSGTDPRLTDLLLLPMRPARARVARVPDPRS